VLGQQVIFVTAVGDGAAAQMANFLLSFNATMFRIDVFVQKLFVSEPGITLGASKGPEFRGAMLLDRVVLEQTFNGKHFVATFAFESFVGMRCSVVHS
jgi:hypothetical protein